MRGRRSSEETKCRNIKNLNFCFVVLGNHQSVLEGKAFHARLRIFYFKDLNFVD